jgi:hypothetical protein
MRTADVKALVREVLESLPRPYSDHVVDDVFSSIEQNPAWLQRYESECAVLGKNVANTWGGYWIANALGKVGEHQVPAKKSTLIGLFGARHRREDGLTEAQGAGGLETHV